MLVDILKQQNLPEKSQKISRNLEQTNYCLHLHFYCTNNALKVHYLQCAHAKCVLFTYCCSSFRARKPQPKIWAANAPPQNTPTMFNVIYKLPYMYYTSTSSKLFIEQTTLRMQNKLFLTIQNLLFIKMHIRQHMQVGYAKRSSSESDALQLSCLVTRLEYHSPSMCKIESGSFQRVVS